MLKIQAGTLPDVAKDLIRHLYLFFKLDIRAGVYLLNLVKQVVDDAVDVALHGHGKSPIRLKMLRRLMGGVDRSLKMVNSKLLARSRNLVISCNLARFPRLVVSAAMTIFSHRGFAVFGLLNGHGYLTVHGSLPPSGYLGFCGSLVKLGYLKFNGSLDGCGYLAHDGYQPSLSRDRLRNLAGFHVHRRLDSLENLNRRLLRNLIRSWPDFGGIENVVNLFGGL